ncbi:MAG: cysteine desulfurase family protein [Alphaproteobacteria bacterium]|nr:cysteine desulfurase family protein [Alphaproteobacteria bacterium]
MIYLDYNATAPMKPAVRAAILEAMERHGNPSSVHRYGRTARRYLEETRALVAALVGANPAQVVFTGSGTEANNMVFYGLGHTNFITSSIEHDSVLACTPDAFRLPVTAEGIVDLAAAEEILKNAPAKSLVSVMLVNNETGVIQPVAEIARLAKTYGHSIHTDAVQAAGRLPIDMEALGVDFLTLSAHKIGGPQGVGALVINEKIGLRSLVKGGGQEKYRRAGTENVPGIVGFGIAAQLAADDLRDVPRITLWRDDLQKRLQGIAGQDVRVIGEGAPRVANTLCIAMRDVESETQVVAMDLAGVAVSAGAACSSGKVKASHVLQAMGFGKEIAGSALRISLGWNTTPGDIDRCAEAWVSLYRRMRNPAQSEAA